MYSNEPLVQQRTPWRQDQSMGDSQMDAQRMRTEDSWIEVNSQSATNAALSNANHDIVTTGLSVLRDEPRSTDMTRSPTFGSRSKPPTSVAGSSQDEYEESESESDQILSSSNEDITKAYEERNSTVTTLGARPDDQRVFTPQPNAFNHPPVSHNAQSTPAPDSYFPAYTQAAYSDRLPSNRMVTPRTITQRQNINSRSQPDHDAALRASLTTLLSCAAAVRPKERQTAPSTQAIQPRTLRLIPESQLGSTTNLAAQTPGKRKSREAGRDHQSKKARNTRPTYLHEELASPTLMTWMISAGVVLVFSAISFSAGYAWGKEAGRMDAELTCISCGTEAINGASGGGSGLRKLRWSSAVQSVRA